MRVIHPKRKMFSPNATLTRRALRADLSRRRERCYW
jgi:hypothetical protein